MQHAAVSTISFFVLRSLSFFFILTFIQTLLFILISSLAKKAGSSGAIIANSSTYFDAATAHGAGGNISPKTPKITYPDWQVWTKPLATGGDRGANQMAVLVINISEDPQSVSISYETLGINAKRVEAEGWSDNGNKDVAGKRTKVTAKDAWTNVEVEAGVGKTGLSLDSIASHDSAFLVLSY